MINEERFWESTIGEAVRNETPPDVTARVLAGLADPPKAEPKPPRKLPVVRMIAELAAAAAVVLAIGWLTGLFRAPQTPAPQPAGNVAAAPGAEYELVDGVIELRGGWLLVTAGSPDVHCGASTLSKVDGRVLVHAAGVPSRGQAEAVESWLRANQLETDMIMQAKSWAKGVALAALVLSGSAMLDGQKVEGPKPEAVATTEWHVVRSVMDIDNLPKGAKYVNADGLDAAHLDFLAEVPTLEAIRMNDARRLRAEHLTALKSLKNLQWLDIRGAEWAEESDLSGLAELPSLKRIGADLIPAQYFEGGKWHRYARGNAVYYNQGLVTRYDGSNSYSSVDYPTFDRELPHLLKLSARGVAIELGLWRPMSEDGLRAVLLKLPSVSSMILDRPTAAMIKVVAGHEQLRGLVLENYDAGQIGLAYLARKARLEEFTLRSDSVQLSEIHQVGRMSLRFLRLDAELRDSPQSCFELLAGMKHLREVELSGLQLGSDADAAFTEFQVMNPLDRLVIEDDVLEWSSAALMLGHCIPTRRLEIHVGQLTVPGKSEVSESLLEGTAGKHVQTLCFSLYSSEFDPGWVTDDQVATLKSYPNLKRIEVRRGGFEEPADQDQFVNWLKESLPGVEVVVTP